VKLSAADLLLDQTHSRAICDEIGERLRIILKPDVSELPPRLLALVEKFDQLRSTTIFRFCARHRSRPLSKKCALMNSGGPKQKVDLGRIATNQRSAPVDGSVGSLDRRTAFAAPEQLRSILLTALAPSSASAAPLRQ
jgi:hypothetical protein